MIYIDAPVHWWRGRMWCHLFADTTPELLQTALAIGLNPRWIQLAGTVREHFDLAPTRRRAALERGARELTRAGVAALIAADVLRCPRCTQRVRLALPPRTGYQNVSGPRAYYEHICQEDSHA